MCTVKRPELEVHASNKHNGKTFKDCFPEYDEDDQDLMREQLKKENFEKKKETIKK
jgi:hypothetical protein